MKHHRQETIKKWSGLVEAHSLSGLSVPEFCRENRVHENNFYSWRSKLKYELNVSEGSHFKELKLSKDTGFTDSSNNTSGIQIYINDKIRIVLANGFDESSLLKTVKTLSDI